MTHEDTRAALRMSLKYRKRIEELEKEKQFILIENERRWESVIPAFHKMEKRVKELEAALKPFADNAHYYENSNAIYNIDHDDRITVADLRNAKAALEKCDGII